MREARCWVLVMAAACWAAGCSGTTTGGPDCPGCPPAPAFDAGQAADGGDAGTVDGGGADGGGQDGGADAGAGVINVAILAPAEGAVLATSTFEVRAQITAPSGHALDASKILAQLGALPAVRMTPLTIDTYQGTLSGVTLDSGPFDIVVSAASFEGGTGSATRRVIINSGPIVTFLRPARSEPVRDNLLYDFQVRIARELTGVTIATGGVSASIGSCNVTLAAPVGTNTSQQYLGPFDLKTCDPLPSDGPQALLVTATDSSGVTSRRSVVFVIDRAGPLIVIDRPRAGELTGGIITVQATVTDPSGVNPLSVFATITHTAGQGFTFALAPGTGDQYSAEFDMRRLPDNDRIQYPAVEVVADDTLGNHSRSGGHQFIIDTVPPVGDLDPPLFFLTRIKDGVTQCSEPFRPTGETPRDLDAVPQLFEVRALILDSGNIGVGADSVYVSKTSSATYYLLDDTTQPLVVDSDGDGICDAINPNVIPVPGTSPGPSQALQLSMVRMAPGGSANFTTKFTIPPPCTPGDDTGEVPKPLCDFTVMTVVLEESRDRTSAIWTLPPVGTGPLEECDGLQFDTLANNIGDGWVCAAVAFVDNVGNRSVSPPLRLDVCRAGAGLCPSPGTPPDCTGRLNPVTGAVTADPCQGVGFD
jgi:hypothetical protein